MLDSIAVFDRLEVWRGRIVVGESGSRIVVGESGRVCFVDWRWADSLIEIGVRGGIEIVRCMWLRAGLCCSVIAERLGEVDHAGALLLEIGIERVNGFQIVAAGLCLEPAVVKARICERRGAQFASHTAAVPILVLRELVERVLLCYQFAARCTRVGE